MIKKDYVRGRDNITFPAPLQQRKPDIKKTGKVISLPVVERDRIISKRFGKTMHIKEILDYMRENKLFPEGSSQIAKNNNRI